MAPAQNILSPPVLAETTARLTALATTIANWAKALPEELFYIFGGLKVGWEAGYGTCCCFAGTCGVRAQSDVVTARGAETTSFCLL